MSTLEIILTVAGLLLTYGGIQAGVLKWVFNGVRDDIHSIRENTQKTAQFAEENRRRLIRLRSELRGRREAAGDEDMVDLKA